MMMRNVYCYDANKHSNESSIFMLRKSRKNFLKSFFFKFWFKMEINECFMLFYCGLEETVKVRNIMKSSTSLSITNISVTEIELI